MNSPAGFIRPPWPDEVPRIADAFPGFLHSPPLQLLVLVADDPNERLLAVAALRPHGAVAMPGGAPRAIGFTAEFFPRVLGERPALADALLGCVIRLAREQGAANLYFNDSLRDDDLRRALLERAGFSPARADELWEIDPRGMFERLERIHAGLVARDRLKGFSVGPVDAPDLPELRALVGTAGLLSPEKIVLAGSASGRAGFDPDYSSLVRRGREITGVLLAKVSGRLSIVEARVVAPAWRGGLNITNHLLFHRSVATGVAAGCERLLFTADPAREAETVRMARRFGGRLASLNRRWVLPLISG